MEAWGLSFAFAKALHDDFVPIALPLIAAWQSNRGSHPVIHITFDKRWWRHGDSNPRHSACKADALPTELYPRNAAAEPLEKLVTRTKDCTSVPFNSKN